MGKTNQPIFTKSVLNKYKLTKTSTNLNQIDGKNNNFLALAYIRIDNLIIQVNKGDEQGILKNNFV